MILETPKIEKLDQKYRVTTFIINVLFFWVIYFITTNSLIPSGSGESVWYISVIAYWILALVAAPFFSPPKDSLGTAISILLLLIPLDLSKIPDFAFQIRSLNYLAIALSIIVMSAALIAILNKTNERLKKVAYKISHTFGKGEVLYTLAVIVSVFGFYQDKVGYMFLIMGLWVFFVMAKPVELIIQLVLYLKNTSTLVSESVIAGSILRIDDPNLLRVVLKSKTQNWNTSVVHVAHMPDGKIAHVLPLFTQVQEQEIVGTGLCCYIKDTPELPIARGMVSEIIAQGDLLANVKKVLGGDTNTSDVVGIVIEGSSISEIRFQAVRGIDLEEGMVVFAYVKNKKIYYQILEAKTDEESFQQNPYGTHIVTASQLGYYDKKSGFKKFSWLPEMNQPIFFENPDSVHENELSANEFLIGKIPATTFGIPVVLDDLVQYHTAVLGVTGTGKTELALEIIKNALNRNTKVFCVDFTGEYRGRLAEYNPELIGLKIEDGSALEQHLFAVETGEFGAKPQRAALKVFLDSIEPQVIEQIESFLSSDTKKLAIFELDQITNTKATLRTTELYLSEIMNWAKKNRKRKKVLIVLEEAHTIIPESYQSGFDADTQWVVGRIGQIALQGRKYGVGLLLVSQRTALVSKTVLSQCNTYFTHNLIDKTSLEYLSSVYGNGHVKAIPNLKQREFIAHGKGIKSELPLLGMMEFDQAKEDASKALDYKDEEVIPTTTASEITWTV